MGGQAAGQWRWVGGPPYHPMEELVSTGLVFPVAQNSPTPEEPTKSVPIN